MYKYILSASKQRIITLKLSHYPPEMNKPSMAVARLIGDNQFTADPWPLHSLPETAIQPQQQRQWYNLFTLFCS